MAHILSVLSVGQMTVCAEVTARCASSQWWIVWSPSPAVLTQKSLPVHTDNAVPAVNTGLIYIKRWQMCVCGIACVRVLPPRARGMVRGCTISKGLTRFKQEDQAQLLQNTKMMTQISSYCFLVGMLQWCNHEQCSRCHFWSVRVQENDGNPVTLLSSLQERLRNSFAKWINKAVSDKRSCIAMILPKLSTT